MSVTGHDSISACKVSAFQNPVVGLIAKHMKVRLGLQDGCHVSERP